MTLSIPIQEYLSIAYVAFLEKITVRTFTGSSAAVSNKSGSQVFPHPSVHLWLAIARGTVIQ